MSFAPIPHELLGLIVGIVGGFVSGVVIRAIPGKARIVLFLDGRTLSQDKPDAEFVTKIKEMKYPVKFLVPQIILLLATLYGVYYFTMQAPVLKEYLLILNLIFTLGAFGGGLSMALMLGNKASIDAILSKEAYKAFMRKAVASSQVPSTLH